MTRRWGFMRRGAFLGVLSGAVAARPDGRDAGSLRLLSLPGSIRQPRAATLRDSELGPAGNRILMPGSASADAGANSGSSSHLPERARRRSEEHTSKLQSL